MKNSDHLPLASIAEVAGESGYSTATVSWALRGHQRVPESTRLKIWAAAERLGYKPDPRLTELMSHLRARRGSVSPTPLALIVPDSAEACRTRSDTKAGIYARAEELGYAVEEFPLDESTGGYRQERLNRVLVSRNIQGVIVYPFPGPEAHLDGLDWSRFAGASCGFTLRKPALHRVVSHHFQGVILALDRLHALGYRRVGLVLTEAIDRRVDRLWRAGYLLQGSQPGCCGLPALIKQSLSEEDFVRWFRRTRPDAILTGAHPRTFPVIDWLKREGAGVPADVGYANLLIRSDYADMAGIDQQLAETGRSLVDLAVGQILGSERGIPVHRRTVLIEGTWHQGSSTRAVNV